MQFEGPRHGPQMDHARRKPGKKCQGRRAALASINWRRAASRASSGRGCFPLNGRAGALKHPHHNNNPDSLENRWHTRTRTWRPYSPSSDSTMSTTIFALRSTGAPSPAETPAHGDTRPQDAEGRPPQSLYPFWLMPRSRNHVPQRLSKFFRHRRMSMTIRRCDSRSIRFGGLVITAHLA